MVKSVNEIAEWAANPPISAIDSEKTPPSRAEFLLNDPQVSSEGIQYRLKRAEAEGNEELKRAIAEIIATVNGRELKLGDKVRVLLALRSTSYWSGMISFAKWADERGPDGQSPFTWIPEVRQQYAMALNRLGGPVNSTLAESALKDIVRYRGGDSETFGILGRVYKDRWLERQLEGEFFTSALNAYWDGLQCNPTEIYPAINLLTLLRIAGYEANKLQGLQSYIELLLEKRLQYGDADQYFDYATRVELYSAMGQFDLAWRFVYKAADLARAPWELETTARSLTLLKRTVASGELDELSRVLRNKAQNTPLTETARSAA